MQINIDEFLSQFIEGYLFSDIENMLKIKLTKNQTSGACGYPIIMSILSGMELLGALLDDENFNRNNKGKWENKGNKYFDNYWNQCFSSNNKIYKINNICELVRKLIRHGLAHNFITKPDILIYQNNKEKHWKISKSEHFLSISCHEFYNDFRNSYYKLFLPKIKKNKTRTKKRVSEILNDYLNEADKSFNEIDLTNLPEEVKYNVDIDRTLGSPVAKLKDILFSSTDASGVTMSCTPFSASPSDSYSFLSKSSLFEKDDKEKEEE